MGGEVFCPVNQPVSSAWPVQSVRVLMQPGWHNSGPEHWQSYWERRLGTRASRVQQRDWERPEREMWLATLRASLAERRGRVVLAAHSIGCLAAAALLGFDDAVRAQVAAAVLVAPADVEREGGDPALGSFAPIAKRPLGVPALVIASTDDPYCALERAVEMAGAWGADIDVIEGAGHINTEAGFGPWPEGWRLVGDWLGRRGLGWADDDIADGGESV